MEDYAHFVGDPSALASRLDLLRDLHGEERIALWKSHLSSGAWEPLVHDLLESHYDPAYRRSLFRNYREAQSGEALEIREISPAGFATLARRLVGEHG
jgi:tRNA 2-selenouridine synthase